MSGALDQIREYVAVLRLDDSLLFLNHLLAVSRNDAEDKLLARKIATIKAGVPPFVVHFLAKQILLHSSNLGIRTLDWDGYRRLYDMYFELDDPICSDPNWKHTDPTGFFERMLGQQFPAQQRGFMQKYGIALGLYRDIGIIDYPIHFDLRGDLEHELGMDVETFIKTGHLFFAMRHAACARERQHGTFRYLDLAEAFAQGYDFAIPEIWSAVLARIACTRNQFRDVSRQHGFQENDERYAPFAFNALRRHPVVDVGDGRFIAVDPDLIVERVTFGLFFDLFGRHGMDFSEKFGFAFERYVGDLLGSGCPATSLWSSNAWERSAPSSARRRTGKHGDWVYTGGTHNVLIECKSLRPSLELLTYGSEHSANELIARIVNALSQLATHAVSIARGDWVQWGIESRPCLAVVVTYGEMITVNGPFVKRQLREKLEAKGLPDIPFVVLSITELDSVVNLVARGHSLEEVVVALARNESFNVLSEYNDLLRERAIGLFSYEKARRFLDTLALSNTSA